MKRVLRLVLALLLTHSGIAAAAIVHVDLGFTATNFSGGSVAPYDPVTGHFAFSFDNAVGDIYSTPILDGTVSIPFIGGITFVYSSQADLVQIGAGIANSVAPGGDFDLIVLNVSSSPHSQNFLYTAAGINGTFQSYTVALTQATKVPEPASLALIGLGLAGLLATRRRRAVRGA